MLEQIKRFFKSSEFLKGVVTAIAIAIPMLFSSFFLNDIQVGFAVALGVLFCSPPDIAGSVKHNFYGVLTAVILATILTLVLGFVANMPWLVYPVLGLTVFFISYISVFGFRASLVSLGGLLAITLGFVHNYTTEELLTHTFLIFLGGIWYLSLMGLKLLLFSSVQTNQLFVKTIEDTAAYLRVRGELISCKTNRDELYQKMYLLQSQINGYHETLREIILSARKRSGVSNSTRRRQLLLSELIDVLELAVANPINYEKVDEIFKDHTNYIDEYKNLVSEIAFQLEHISKVIRGEEKLKENEKIPEILHKIELNINYYKILVGLPKSRVGTLMLRNFKNYQEKQVQKISGIERILNNYTNNNKILSKKEATRFITPQDYDLKKLVVNFSFKSPVFKHSLRLAIVIVLGFIIGKMLSMQNPYWILITIVVIMRPSYGLTISRTQNRVLGTFIGGAIATLIIFTTHNTVVYGVLALMALPFSFSLVQLNYRNAATFITLQVVLVYAIMQPDILAVIQFRILDTLIGASLAILSNYFLWPSWEFQNIHEYFSKAIKANQQFLEQISIFYHKKGEVSTVYKLHRKEAFLAIGNLNTAFQRMNQDPKSKQKDYAIIYELIVINNTFLSSSASLGTFIRNNKTSEVPEEFDVFIKNICANLQLAVQLLEEDNSKLKTINQEKIEEAHDLYDTAFEDLSNKRDKELEQGKEISSELKIKLRETLLVSEQVKWLFDLSEKLVSSIKKYKSGAEGNSV